MLDYCARQAIVVDVEVIIIKEVNTAYERLIENGVSYRCVIDMTFLVL